MDFPGTAAHQSGFDLITGSLADGVGCSGAFIAGPKKMISSLLFHSHSVSALGA